MLHLILGAAGTGKTALLHEKIAECVRGGGKAVLLVPEQYSFESEKALYRRLGAKDALSVEVLSFTRLCDRIFREYGGLAGVHLDETAKVLLMSVALGEIGGELRAYRKNVSGAGVRRHDVRGGRRAPRPRARTPKHCAPRRRTRRRTCGTSSPTWRSSSTPTRR